MRIVNIINNELILRKQKLENELERVLNKTDITTEKKVTKCGEIIDKLSIVNTSLQTWEQYTNKTKTEK